MILTPWCHPIHHLTAKGTALACNEVIHCISEILQVEVFFSLQGGVLKQTKGVSQSTLNLGFRELPSYIENKPLPPSKVSADF